jgi:hypothetical protein
MSARTRLSKSQWVILLGDIGFGESDKMTILEEV